MPTHRGFTAWIVSEGKELAEYDVVVDYITNKVTCWIRCEIGKTFSVHWLDRGTNIDSAAYITLDGFTVPGRFLYGLGAAERSSVRVSDRLERPFQFASPALDAANPSNLSSEVGTICLKIKQIKRTVPDHAPNAPLNPPGPGPLRTYLGAPEARVGYGTAHPAPLQHFTTWSFDPYDPSQPGSYVQFIFRYRTQEFLAQQGIFSGDLPRQQIAWVMERFPTNGHRSTRTPKQEASELPSLPPQEQTHSVPPTGTIDPALLALPPRK